MQIEISKIENRRPCKLRVGSLNPLFPVFFWGGGGGWGGMRLQTETPAIES